MVRHAPIHRRSGHSDIAICCGCNVRGSSLSTSVAPLSNQVTTLNHKRFKGFKMFSDGHLDVASSGASVHLDAGGFHELRVGSDLTTHQRLELLGSQRHGIDAE